MKSGVSMSGIVDTRKDKKNRTMIDCNCRICVNRHKKECRFGWEPINGKCSRFGKGHYKLSKEEVSQAREQTFINKEEHRKKIEASKEAKKTSLKKLSDILETTITMEKIKNCKRYRYLGNGKFSIKCVNSKRMIINVKFKNGELAKYKIIDI